MEKNNMKVVICRPGQRAEITTIENSLDSYYQVIKTDIVQAVYPYEDPVCIICDEEGKFKSSQPPCRALRTGEAVKVTLPYDRLVEMFRHAHKCGVQLEGYIVISQSSFTKEYSVEARTYKITAENKAFDVQANGYSIYGTSLDGTDSNVRLDRYLKVEHGEAWDIEECYIYDYPLYPIA